MKDHSEKTMYDPVSKVKQKSPRLGPTFLTCLLLLLVFLLPITPISVFAAEMAAEESELEESAEALPAEEEMDADVEETQAEETDTKKSFTLDMYKGLLRFALGSYRTDMIQFRDSASNPFLSNELDELTVETEPQAFGTMGRVVIPSIGTNGPLMEGVDLYGFATQLAYGFGLINLRDYRENLATMEDKGQTTIVGHRILTKTGGLYYVDEMKLYDPFYVDDYRAGKRYHYVMVKQITIPGEELNKYVFIDQSQKHATIMGRSCLLVVCDPRIFFAEDDRILTYGQFSSEEEIPQDDPWYQRYLEENGLDLEEERSDA